MPSLERKPKRRWSGVIWVCGTTLLISWIAYSSQLFIILPTFRSGIDAAALQFIVPFNIVVALIFINYAVCIRSDPGGVPPGWSPPKESGESSARFCRSCNAYKPPRAHHCRHCRRCVLRMDHHNCVGHANYAAFIRFLVLVDVGCAMHLYKVSQCAFGRSFYYAEPTTRYMVILILNYATAFPVLLAVGCFTVYHLICLSSNTTTIEGFEKSKVASLRRRGRAPEGSYPFNLGILRNIRAVMGDSPLLWCWPPQRVAADGLFYPVRFGIDPAEQYAWPPRDRFAPPAPRRLHDGPFQHDGLLHSLAPPYANSYDTGRDLALDEDDLASSDDYLEGGDDDDDDDDVPLSRLRRGSEGYEVRPYTAFEREQLVRRYAATRGEDLPDRYRRYSRSPSPGSDT